VIGSVEYPTKVRKFRSCGFQRSSAVSAA
jgi:hypothetical protein